MIEWWAGLSTLAQVLFVSAVFFTALLVLQLVFSFGDESDDGDGGDVDGGDADGGDADADDADVHHQGSAQDDSLSGHVDHGSASAALWRGFASRRSAFAFLTLFSWAGALYLQGGHGTLFALGMGAVWGVVGSVCVAGVYLTIRFLQAPGDAFGLDAAVGEEGTVYLRIPEAGAGQVRVPIDGRWQIVRACAAGGGAIPENTPIFITRVLDARTVEVIPARAVTG